MLNTTSLTTYAIYGASGPGGYVGSSPRALEPIGIVNLGQYNISQSAAARPYAAFTLPPDSADWSAVQVRRLTAPRTDAKLPKITFARQYVDASGLIAGELAIEPVTNGQVLIAAGEAVLVTI